MSVVPQSTVSVTPLAANDAGIRQTLAAMRSLILASQQSELVVSVAREIVASSVPKWHAQSQVAISTALARWLSTYFRFVPDPRDHELLRDADNMILSFQRGGGFVLGDCDEAAILGASLGVCVGIDADLTVLEFRGQPTPGFSHVFARLLPDDGPAISLDVTRPVGVPTPLIARYYTVPV